MKAQAKTLSAELEKVWQEERDRFVVLLHFYNGLDFGECRFLRPGNIMRDLGLSAPQVDALLSSLLHANLLGYARNEPGMQITNGGVDYIEIGRGRRQSVRLVNPTGPMCPLPE